MTQFDFGNIDPDNTSGTDLSENILEPWRNALHSCHKGSTRPSYAGAGMMWIDDSATPWLIKVYTGSTDCIIGSIAPSTGVFNVRSDVISEASSGAGVTVDGVLLKDSAVTTDTINEKTTDAGVTIDGVLLKDGGGAAAMTSAGGNFPNVNADVTATDEELNKLDGYSGDIPTAGWSLLDSQTAAGSSSLDFTSGIDGTYYRYMFVVDRIYASGSTQLYLRVSSDGGSTWESGSTDYNWTLLNEDGASTSASNDSGIRVKDEISDVILAKGEVILDELGGGGQVTGDRPSFRSDIHLGTTRDFSQGSLKSSVTADAVQFYPASGTLDGGTVYLYGWKDGS